MSAPTQFILSTTLTPFSLILRTSLNVEIFEIEIAPSAAGIANA